MKESVGGLLEAVYQHYPRGVAHSDPRYHASPEYVRLKDARRQAAENRGPWRAMLQRLRDKFQGQELTDKVLLCPAEALSSAYSCSITLPPTSGERHHAILLVMSFLVPRYVIYSERYVDDPEPPPPPDAEVVAIFVDDTVYYVPTHMLAPEVFDALMQEAEARLAANPALAAILVEVQSHARTRRVISPLLSADEQAYAAEVVREVAQTFGYEPMPPDVGGVVVPDVETSSRVFGEATLYACLVSED